MRVGARIQRTAAAVTASVLFFGVAQVVGAAPAFADGDLSVASVTVGIGSSVSQQVTILDGSGLIGQDTPIVVMPDPGIAGTGFTVNADAGNTGGTCAQDSGDDGFTCDAPAAGWSAGYLDLDFDAGDSTTAVPACGANCTFTTSVYETSSQNPPNATGTITAQAEADLSLMLTAVSGGALTVSVNNTGPTETADLSVDITGADGYSVSSGDPDCSAVGGAYVCDAGDTTGAVDDSNTWTLQFSGSTGPIAIDATAFATVYPDGTASTLSGSASTPPLSWTPITAVVAPTSSSTSSTVALPSTNAPSPGVTVTASATAKATAQQGGKTVAPGVVGKAKRSVSASASASVSAKASASKSAGGPTAHAAQATGAAGVGPSPITVLSEAPVASDSSGSQPNTLVLILICALMLVLLAFAVWRALVFARRRRDAEAADAPRGAARQPQPSTSAPVPVPAPVLVPVVEELSGAESAPVEDGGAQRPSVSMPSAEQMAALVAHLSRVAAQRTAEPEPSADVPPAAGSELESAGQPESEPQPELQSDLEPESEPELQPDLEPVVETGAVPQRDVMEDTGPIELARFFTRPIPSAPTDPADSPKSDSARDV
jgi:hypothetical protein